MGGVEGSLYGAFKNAKVIVSKYSEKQYHN